MTSTKPQSPLASAGALHKLERHPCPTCRCDWSLNPPARCGKENVFRCINCKALYTGEMLAAPAMHAALEDALIWLDPDAPNESRYQFRDDLLAAIRAALATAREDSR